MFEESQTAARSLVDRIAGSARAANQATARMLVAVGDLYRLRLREVGDAAYAACDTLDTVSAEVAAALTISTGLARSHVQHALTMHDRLPQVGSVFVAGDIDYFMFQTIVTRINLVLDPEALASVDGQIAAAASRWTTLSKKQVAARVDRIVARVDPDAKRRRKEAFERREIWIADRNDGLSDIGGTLFTTAAHALDKRLNALAATVCEHDPRTTDQRRADAVEAMVVGADRMACRCDRPDCAAGGLTAGPVVIHVIADQATIDGNGSNEGSLVGADGLLAPEVIAEVARTAKLRPLTLPGDAPPEPRYIPSRALAEYVRCRDLTCRFPGCDRPAARTDIDHTVPHAAGGPTQAANLKSLCRLHHLIKTFGGWKDQQLPDGAVIWTSPSGHTYITTPGSALLFPTLCTPTALAAPTKTDGPRGDRNAKMPQRRRTRAQNRAAAVAKERAHNRAMRQKERRETYAFLSGNSPDPDDEPPPF
ncbi:HNH endonuclease signature motif containing protein [Mycolicibacterium litorale]|uniref:HNH endonuclease signature motif containing protein n=1 Tax=Mycolicibacterium litorale TaxID=758802 RepID=UPI003CE94B50